MTKRVHKFIVVYDLSDDKERRHIDNILKNYGFRIQKSVFECTLSHSEQKRMLADIKVIAVKTGFVRVYKVDYSSKIHTIGAIGNSDPDADNAFFV